MMMARIDDLPVAVIGAGPVGLAAAAHLVQRGIRPLIFERGAERWRIAFSNGRMCASFRRGATTSIRPPDRCWKRSGWTAPDADGVANRRRARCGTT